MFELRLEKYHILDVQRALVSIPLFENLFKRFCLQDFFNREAAINRFIKDYFTNNYELTVNKNSIKLKFTDMEIEFSINDIYINISIITDILEILVIMLIDFYKSGNAENSCYCDLKNGIYKTDYKIKQALALANLLNIEDISNARIFADIFGEDYVIK